MINIKSAERLIVYDGKWFPNHFEGLLTVVGKNWRIEEK